MFRIVHRNLSSILRPKPNLIRLTTNNKFATQSTEAVEKRTKTKGEPKDEEVNNEPMNFFGSQAAAWKAKSSRSGGSENTLWYQPYVISASLAVFLIYFCILREENDVDLKLDKSLYDHVEGLEEVQLTMNYRYNRDHSLDNSVVEKRLKELGVDVSKL